MKFSEGICVIAGQCLPSDTLYIANLSWPSCHLTTVLSSFIVNKISFRTWTRATRPDMALLLIRSPFVAADGLAWVVILEMLANGDLNINGLKCFGSQRDVCDGRPCLVTLSLSHLVRLMTVRADQTGCESDTNYRQLHLAIVSSLDSNPTTVYRTSQSVGGSTTLPL